MSDMELKDKREYWVSYLADKKGGSLALATALGYKDANYVNQVKNGHTALGNGNAEEWCRKLGLRSGWFDREPPGEGRSAEIYEKFSEATEEEMLDAVKAIAQIVARDDALLMARYFLDRASSVDQEQS